MRSKTPNVQSTMVILLAIGSSLLLSACGPKHKPSSTHSGSSLPTMQVLVQKVEAKPYAITEEVVGTVRAKVHATLEAKVNGRIEAMPVVLGDKVQKGQLIARLSAAEIAARLEQAQAGVEQAERDWKRVSGLFQQQATTRAEYESAESRLRIAKATAAEAKAMMAYIEISAPFDGVITRKWADVGDLAVPGKPLVNIDDPSTLQLEADVPEATAGRIHRNEQLGIRVDAFNTELHGTVSELAPTVDPLSRTFRVKLDLPATPGLMPGQFARLIVPIGETNSLRVPASAVVERGQLEIVFVKAGSNASLHLVKTGKRFGDEVEVLSGLNAGDEIVTRNAALLTDGQPVEVK